MVLSRIRYVIVSHCSITVFSYCFDKFTSLQAFLKLRHESGVEHIFVVEGSGKQFEIILVKFVEHILSIFMKHPTMLQFSESCINCTAAC